MGNNATQVIALAFEKAPSTTLDSWRSAQIGITWTIIITRGVLGGSILKQLDSIAKGLIDVTAIVLCTAIQIMLDGSESADGTVIGIQSLMLLSIVSFIIARSSSSAYVKSVYN